MLKFVLGTAAAFLAAVSMAAADTPKGHDAKCIDGAWTVVCYEKNGETQPDAKGMSVKAAAGTVTCSGKDGKAAMTLKVEFGPNGTVRVTENPGDASATAAKAGVYVLTQDLLAISLNADPAPAGGDVKAAAEGSPAKPQCNIVLKRDGAK